MTDNYNWFTTETAKKILGDKQYQDIWQNAYDKSFREWHDKNSATSNADKRVRSFALGTFISYSWMLTYFKASDKTIKQWSEKTGATLSQIQEAASSN